MTSLLADKEGPEKKTVNRNRIQNSNRKGVLIDSKMVPNSLPKSTRRWESGIITDEIMDPITPRRIAPHRTHGIADRVPSHRTTSCSIDVHCMLHHNAESIAHRIASHLARFSRRVAPPRHAPPRTASRRTASRLILHPMCAGSLAPSAWGPPTCRASVGGVSFCSSCLLYTSPSPRDQRGSRMPSSA